MASTRRIRKPKQWQESYLDSRYTRKFGPITAVCTRSVDYKDENMSCAYGYFENMNGEDCEFRFTYVSLGVQWWDDQADALALREMDKRMKATIRGWTRK